MVAHRSSASILLIDRAAGHLCRGRPPNPQFLQSAGLEYVHINDQNNSNVPVDLYFSLYVIYSIVPILGRLLANVWRKKPHGRVLSCSPSWRMGVARVTIGRSPFAARPSALPRKFSEMSVLRTSPSSVCRARGTHVDPTKIIERQLFGASAPKRGGFKTW